jgi:hypothetical protein
MYLVDVRHLEPVAAGMEVLLDGVQGALQHSALLWGQAALTLLRDVLEISIFKKPFFIFSQGKQSSSIYDSWSKLSGDTAKSSQENQIMVGVRPGKNIILFMFYLL